MLPSRQRLRYPRAQGAVGAPSEQTTREKSNHENIPILLGAGSRLRCIPGVALGRGPPCASRDLSLTGPGGPSPGKDVLAAVKVAQDIVNNKHDLDLPLAATEGLPNLGGAKIELVVADHQGKARDRPAAKRSA